MDSEKFFTIFYGNTRWKIKNEKFEACGNVKFITERDRNLVGAEINQR